MISEKIARRMGIRFFREQMLHQYADKLKTGEYCLSSLFSILIVELGKPRVYKLYCHLPEQLKHYVLRRVTHTNTELTDRFREIDGKYSRAWNSERPERLKGFQAYMQELQEAVLKFLVS